MYAVIGSSGRVLYEGTLEQCESWVEAGNVGGGYSIERVPSVEVGGCLPHETIKE